MKRSYKVFVAVILALSLCLSFGSAFAKKENKPPKSPAPAVTISEFTLSDRIGTLSPVVTEGSPDTYSLVTGQKYVAKAVLSSGSRKSLRWRSTKSSVARVDSKGNIKCARSGDATITVSDKSGAVLKSFNLEVLQNIATFTATEEAPVQKIYLKGKYIYVDVLVRNDTLEVMETPKDLTISLTLARGTSPASGLKTGHLRDELLPGETGTAFYRMGKVDPSKVWLPGATCVVA